MMIIYHAAYDLYAFYGWGFDPFSGGWKLLALGTASLFLLLVGIGFSLSWERNRGAHRYPVKYLKRGLGLIALGMIVSVVTYAIDPVTYVRFGILHVIGTSILLLPLVARLQGWNGIIGVGVILIGLGVGDAAAPASLPGLLVLGLRPVGFVSVDYFPLVPWFGVVLVGYAIGYVLYVRSQKIPNPKHRIPHPLLWPGRHALLIYLLHQPVLLLLLTLILGLPKL